MKVERCRTLEVNGREVNHAVELKPGGLDLQG